MGILDIESLETWNKTAAWASWCAQAILIILVRRQANATPEETPVATLKAQDLLACEVDLNDAIISNYQITDHFWKHIFDAIMKKMPGFGRSLAPSGRSALGHDLTVSGPRARSRMSWCKKRTEWTESLNNLNIIDSSCRNASNKGPLLNVQMQHPLAI